MGTRIRTEKVQVSEKTERRASVIANIFASIFWLVIFATAIGLVCEISGCGEQSKAASTPLPIPPPSPPPPVPTPMIETYQVPEHGDTGTTYNRYFIDVVTIHGHKYLVGRCYQGMTICPMVEDKPEKEEKPEK